MTWPRRWPAGSRRRDGGQPEVAESLKPGMHASTFGANPIAWRAGIATVETIEEDGLLERGQAIGEHSGHIEALRASARLHRRDPHPRRDDRPGTDDRRRADHCRRCLERRLLVNAPRQRGPAAAGHESRRRADGPGCEILAAPCDCAET